MKADNTEVKPPLLKIKFQVKLIALLLSVLSLSWFFHGLRQMRESANLEHFALLIISLLLTGLLLWVQAFWIYLEEKSKGSLKKKVAHFDRMEQWLSSKTIDKDKKA